MEIPSILDTDYDQCKIVALILSFILTVVVISVFAVLRAKDIKQAWLTYV